MSDNILIVDDDPDIHAFIKHDLRKSAFKLVSAFTVEEAIEKLGEFNFTMALVDIFLGETESSNQVIHFLKQDLAGPNKNLPIAIMSARMEDDYARKLLLRGPTVFSTFRKPFRPGVFESVIRGKDEPAVLVIDDDPDILSLIKRELVKGGYQVFGSLNGQQAKKLISTTEFIGAIVDNKLGEESDSQDFSDFIGQLPREHQIPLILTGKKINQAIQENESLLVTDTIEKPFKKGAFLEAVNRIRRWMDESNDQSEFIKGVTQHYKEESTIVSGNDDGEDEEVNVIKGAEEKDDSVTTVGGWDEEEDKSKTTIAGEKEDLREETQMIKGEAFQPDDHKTVVKGLDIGHVADDNNPNKRNKQGVTPAMAYCYTGDFDKIKKLVLEGANLQLKARNGKNCLHYAAYSKNYDLVNFLVNIEKLRVNERDESKREPVYDAIKANDPEMVRLFIELGARVRSKFDGKNYLILAVQNKVPEVAKVFVDAGISPNDKDYDGKSALDYAMKLGQQDLVNYMKSHSS